MHARAIPCIHETHTTHTPQTIPTRNTITNKTHLTAHADREERAWSPRCPRRTPAYPKRHHPPCTTAQHIINHRNAAARTNHDHPQADATRSTHTHNNTPDARRRAERPPSSSHGTRGWNACSQVGEGLTRSASLAHAHSGNCAVLAHCKSELVSHTHTSPRGTFDEMGGGRLSRRDVQHAHTHTHIDALANRGGCGGGARAHPRSTQTLIQSCSTICTHTHTPYTEQTHTQTSTRARRPRSDDDTIVCRLKGDGVNRGRY